LIRLPALPLRIGRHKLAALRLPEPRLTRLGLRLSGKGGIKGRCRGLTARRHPQPPSLSSSHALCSPHHAEDLHNPSSTRWPTARPRSLLSRGPLPRRTNFPVTKKAPVAVASAHRRTASVRYPVLSLRIGRRKLAAIRLPEPRLT